MADLSKNVKWILVFLGIFCGCWIWSEVGVAKVKSVAMNEPLEFKVRCKTTGDCLMGNEELAVELELANLSEETVGVALEYLRKTGPVIKVVNVETGQEIFLKNNLADQSLRDKLELIAPGANRKLNWVILRRELENLCGPCKELNAELSILATVDHGGEKREIQLSDKFRIKMSTVRNSKPEAQMSGKSIDQEMAKSIALKALGLEAKSFSGKISVRLVGDIFVITVYPETKIPQNVRGEDWQYKVEVSSRDGSVEKVIGAP